MSIFGSSETFCDRYNSYNFSGKSYAITDQYNGIPQNLITNICISTFLMTLYVIFHNCVKKCRLIRIFYRKESSVYQVHSDGIESVLVKEPVHCRLDQTTLSGIRKRLPKFIQMNIEQIKRCRGEDAALYLKFQRTLLILVFIIMIASIVIILPINKSGGLVSNDVASFTTFTIGNVPGESPFLWAHFTISSTILIIAFIIASRYFRAIEVDDEEISDTLMLKHLPLEACEELAIDDYFKIKYPTLNVRRVTILHRSDEIIKFNDKKDLAETSLKYCMDKLEQKNKDIPVVPSYCGRCSYQALHCVCPFRGCCQKQNGIEFYQEEIKYYTEKLVEAKLRSLKPDYQLGMAIVQFGSSQEAYRVYKDYLDRNRCYYAKCECLRDQELDDSDYIRNLKAHQWKIKYARPLAEINWENLHVRGWLWYFRAIFLFLVTFTICFILITPSYTLQMLNTFKISQGINLLRSPLISQVAPSVILVLVNSMLPILVYYSVKLSGYHFLTREHITIMMQVYGFLILSLLILPSFGLTGLPQLFRMLNPKKGNESIFHWECIFMPDGGAIYCNYLISAAFTGISLEFLRFGALFSHCWGILGARSKAEEFYIRKKSRWEFEFGLNYAWTLAIFSVIAAYAVIVPIITPCGLFYLTMKHLVDWHHITNVNRYTSVHNSVHTNAALLMQYSLILIHCTVTGYIVLKRGVKNALSILTIFILVLAVAFVIFRSVYENISHFFRRTECFQFLHAEYMKLNLPVVPHEEKSSKMIRGRENSRNFLVIQNHPEREMSRSNEFIRVQTQEMRSPEEQQLQEQSQKESQQPRSAVSVNSSSSSSRSPSRNKTNAYGSIETDPNSGTNLMENLRN